MPNPQCRFALVHTGNPRLTPNVRPLVQLVRGLTDDGQVLADFLLVVIHDPEGRTPDRINACDMLLERRWGKEVRQKELDKQASPLPSKHYSIG